MGAGLKGVVGMLISLLNEGVVTTLPDSRCSHALLTLILYLCLISPCLVPQESLRNEGPKSPVQQMFSQVRHHSSTHPAYIYLSFSSRPVLFVPFALCPALLKRTRQFLVRHGYHLLQRSVMHPSVSQSSVIQHSSAVHHSFISHSSRHQSP